MCVPVVALRADARDVKLRLKFSGNCVRRAVELHLNFTTISSELQLSCI